MAEYRCPGRRHLPGPGPAWHHPRKAADVLTSKTTIKTLSFDRLLFWALQASANIFQSSLPLFWTEREWWEVLCTGFFFFFLWHSACWKSITGARLITFHLSSSPQPFSRQEASLSPVCPNFLLYFQLHLIYTQIHTNTPSNFIYLRVRAFTIPLLYVHSKDTTSCIPDYEPASTPKQEFKHQYILPQCAAINFVRDCPKKRDSIWLAAFLVSTHYMLQIILLHLCWNSHNVP